MAIVSIVDYVCFNFVIPAWYVDLSWPVVEWPVVSSLIYGAGAISCGVVVILVGLAESVCAELFLAVMAAE